MIRRLFSEIPEFYTIYFHLIRKHRGLRPSYFASTTDIYYDGYPRSGNTFLNQLIVNVFPTLNGVHHLHKIAPIKIALRMKIPVFILIRDPKEAISSNYLKYYASSGVIPKETNISLLNRMANDYYYYYNFVGKNIDRIHVIQFEDLIKSSTDTIKMIADKLNIDIGSYDSLKNKVKAASDNYGGAKTKYGSSKPNIFKEQEKKKIKENIPHLDNYKRVTEAYHEIID